MKSLVLFTALALLLLPACSRNRVEAGGVSYASTAGYQTWAWSPHQSLSLRDPSRNTAEVRGWLEQAIDSELGTKGLIKGAPDSADLLVAYGAGSGPRSSTQEFAAAGAPVADHEEGRLVIDLIDRRTGQIVYRGTAKAALLEKASEKRSVPRVHKAVAKVLDDFRK